MICKFCNSELEGGSMVCPVCGCMLTAESEQIGEALVDGLIEEALPQEMTEMDPLFENAVEEQPDEQDKPEEKRKPKLRLWHWIVICVTAIFLTLAALWQFYVGFDFDFGNRKNDISYRDSYTVKDLAARMKADEVVATVGDLALTNDMLQIHYWMQVYDFQSYYGSSYFDASKPLDEQWYSESGKITWQQYFIEAAIESWRRNAVLYHLALESDNSGDYVTMAQTVSKHYLDNLKTMAEKYGYEDADAMVKADMGVSATVDGYTAYMVLYNISASYYGNAYDTIDPTIEQLEEYFVAHKAEYAQKGITKDSGKLVDVRHILLEPEGGTKDANGKTVYTQEAWDACYAKAEALLTQWQNGEATEASFGELANANSVDPGSNTHGGLYTAVSKGYMVEPFDAWIFDESRESGNTGIVKTDFGYHIMYFVGSEDVWLANAREDFIGDRLNEMVDTASDKWKINVNYKKIALSQMTFG